jgi:hypothetical protein
MNEETPLCSNPVAPRPTAARRVGVVILACALTSLGCGPSPEPRDKSAVRRAEALAVSVPIGVYRGAGGWGAERIPAYETFLGRPVNYALDFQATDSWANLSFPNWQADPWQASGKTLILGATGIFPGDWNRQYQGQSVGWAQAARGDYDSYWRTFGQNLVAKGQARAILRGAHEFNGGWFAHRVNPGEQEHFIAAWRRWVDIMRSIPGQQFSFDWNPTLGTEALWNPESAYPGDAYVTHIALDVYDGWFNRGWKPGVDAPPSQAERDAVWDTILNGPRGLKFWKSFAEAHNKRLSLPEWGLRIWTESDGLIHGGGDNPSFIERMHAIINDPGWNIAYHAFWEDPKNGVSDPDSVTSIPVPNSRAAFLRLFGGSAQPSAGTIQGLGGRCVEVAGGNTADSTPVQIWDCNGTSAQQWSAPAVGVQGTVKHASGKCLDVRNGSTADGTPVQLYTCNGTAAQQWTLTSVGEFKGPGGKCLDLNGASTANGTGLILWTCHGGTNQRWSVNPALYGQVRTGAKAARAVLSSSPSWTNMWQTRAAASNSTYEASVWIRGTGSVELKVLRGNWGAIITSVRCNATESWVNCKTPQFSTGADSQLTYVIQDQFGSNPAGTMYLDDAFVGAPGGTNMLTNPGFEEGATGWGPSGVFSVP